VPELAPVPVTSEFELVPATSEDGAEISELGVALLAVELEFVVSNEFAQIGIADIKIVLNIKPDRIEHFMAVQRRNNKEEKQSSRRGMESMNNSIPMAR
jgi:hypothetical protein